MVVYKYKKKDNDMTVYRRSMMEALAEVRGIQTEAMSSAQIDKLKKAYEPMRDKKISVSNANKLSAMMDKFAKDKETLIQLFKADIPFVSKSAVTQLITKHGMKGAEINKFREEFGVKSVDIDELTKKQKQLDVDKDGDIGSDDLAALRKKAGGPYGGKLKKEEDELDEAKRMPPMDDADIQGMYRQVIQLMKHGRSQSSALKYAAKDVGATKKETAKVKQKLDKTGFKEEADLDEIAPVVVGALRAVAAKKVASKGYEKADDEDEEVELDEKTKWKMGDGRPRGGSHIENERFWDLPKSSLEYIIKDAGEAMKLNPTARKATTGRGNWADQVNDAHTVLGWRRKNSIIEESARSDSMKAMRKSGEFKDKDDDDIRATDADVKAASKNILMQMKSAADLPKGGEIEFLDKKKVKVPQKVAQLFVQKYMSLRRPADKAKFQEKAAKSYKDFVSAMKEGVESEHTILDRIHNKIQERKNV